MFGYVTAHKDLLRVCDYNLFRGYYCGLCKTLGKRFNQLTRLGLSYDMTFLAVLISALSDTETMLKQEPCIAHPVSRRPVIKEDAGILYGADMSILLTYYKLLDDWQDEHSFKSLARIFYALPVKKVKKQYPRQAAAIQKQLKALHKLEQENCDNPDAVAHCFGNLLEEIFDIGGNNPALKHLGYHIGRLIYLTDAYCDIEEDGKKKNYNPFLSKYGSTVSKEILAAHLVPSLNYTLSEIACAYELLDIKKNKELLDNIIYLGLRKNVETLSREETKKEKHNGPV
ncbi:MAG: hypothetical protein J6K51_03655 [Clostridia bacterium]|nr:hypothetical protein [Clostridia bacterium]